MKNLVKNLLIILFVFLLISGIFSLFASPFKQEKEIPLSQLIEEINQEKVKKIVISGNNLLVIYQDDTEAISKKEPETALSQSLKNYGVDIEKLKKIEVESKEASAMSAWLGPALLLFLPLILFVFFFWFIFRQARTGATQAFDFTKARARLFGAEGKKLKERVTFKDVGGLKEAKEELEEVVDFLRNPKKYLQIGAKIPRGLLLVGPPGTGKTLLAKAIASLTNVPFFSVSGSSFIELFVGVGSSRIRSLFEQARKSKRAIIFIDEIDSIGKMRGVGIGGGHEEREQTLNQLLAEMDGISREEELIVMAASVTGDTLVLIKKDRECKLLPISEVIDPHYSGNEEGIEKFINGLEILGFERKTVKNNPRIKNKIYFQNSTFKKARSVFRHKVNEIYEIRYNGGILKTTGNHSVFVRTSEGLKTKAVKNLEPGDILVNLPFKVNRTTNRKEIRAHYFNPEFDLELPVWQPLFEKAEPIRFAYQYSLAKANEFSQFQLGRMFGVSQTAISRWQRGISLPKGLSRNRYQHKDILPEKIKVTSGLCRLLGYFAAEGYAGKGVDFCLNRNEKNRIEDIKILMKKIFNLEPSKIRFITPGAINILYHSTPVGEFFGYHCGKGAKNKHLPNFLFGAPFEYFREFVRGYFGDGYLDKRGKSDLTSISKKIILELNWLFRMQGFKTYITSFIAKEGRRIGNGKPLSETLAWRLGFGKTQNPLNEKDIRIKGSVCRPIVKKVRKVPFNGYVYDFCGCENEAFFGGESPILLHNTNQPQYLDSALLRPGRFDRRIVLDLPDINDREEILKIHCRGKPLALNVNLREIAERTPGFSGADLANLVNEAAIFAARRNKAQVFQKEFLESIEKVLLGPERKSHILSKKEKEIAAYHEAGHALVSTSLPGTEPIRKISIIARGMAAGYTLKMPTEERKIKTKSQFLAELATLLGGYCAEKLKFKEITTGAANDLEKASDLAKKLVREYGMSSLGPVAFGEKERFGYLGEISHRDYSEKVAAKIDKEISLFIEEAQKKASKILKKKKKVLEKIAKTLIEKETIEKEEFEKLVKSRKQKPRKVKKKVN